MTITIHPILALSDNYVWAMLAGNRAVIVDPGDAAPVQTYLHKHGLRLAAILITHHHWDHTGGIKALKKEYDVPVFGSANEPIELMNIPLQEPNEVIIADFPLRFHVIDIPGHTLGHIAYYAENVLFCGDTLFAAGCGRVFEGTMAQMYSSLEKIAALPDDTNIYCAHEYTLNNLRFAKLVEPHNRDIDERIKSVSALREKNLPSLPSLLSDEKKTNPFLRCDVPDVIIAAEAHADCKLRIPVEVFGVLRKWKDGFR